MNRRNIALAIIVIAVVSVGLYLLLGRDSKQSPTTTPVAEKATVLITEQGFSPSTITVSKGTTVVWTNQDAKPHQVAADPYPSASSFPELFSKQPIGSEGSYSFRFKNSGTWTYHDQLNPEMSGTIVVE